MPMPTPEKVVDTYRKVTIFYGDLVALAAKYEKAEDKSSCALEAVNATIAFLRLLRIDKNLLNAFAEARNAIQRDRKAETLFGQRQIYDVWGSAVISLLNEEGILVKEAAKKIHGRDPDEARRLLDFRNNMKKSKGAKAKKTRDTYHQLKNELRARFPTNTGARALRDFRAMLGKKG